MHSWVPKWRWISFVFKVYLRLNIHSINIWQMTWILVKNCGKPHQAVITVKSNPLKFLFTFKEPQRQCRTIKRISWQLHCKIWLSSSPGLVEKGAVIPTCRPWEVSESVTLEVDDRNVGPGRLRKVYVQFNNVIVRHVKGLQWWQVEVVMVIKTLYKILA